MERKKIELKNFEDEYLIKVQGGKYVPSFTNELKEVFDIEACKYITTQLMWLEVMENNPSEVKGFYKPVETVSWQQALEFCNKLSEKYGLEPVYDLSRSKQEILMIKELGKKIVSPYEELKEVQELIVLKVLLSSVEVKLQLLILIKILDFVL